MTFRQGNDVNADWSVNELRLQVVDSRRFHIITPFRYVTDPELKPPDGFPGNSADHRIPVDVREADQQPAGQHSILVPGWPLDPAAVPHHATESCRACTDFASVPRAIRGVLGTYGPQLAAALVHDELCHRVESMAKSERRGGRDYTDATFHNAMRADQKPEPVSAYQARLFWGGVSIMRYAMYRKLDLVLLLVGMVAGWLTILLTLQLVLTAIGEPLHDAIGSHWFTKTWLIALLALVFLLASGYFIGRSKRNNVAWVIFWISGVVGVYGLCLWLPLPLTHQDTFPVFGWVIDYSRLPACESLLIIALLIFALGTFLRRAPDRFLGIVAISALPWALPVALLTFIAQRALQIPDNTVPAKPTMPPEVRLPDDEPSATTEAAAQQLVEPKV